MLDSSPERRNQKARMFRGKLTELQCALWLVESGWVINALEAFREGSDLEATDPAGNSTAIEVKFVGNEDADFVEILKSIRGERCGRFSSPYSGVNYLVFRAYECSVQLKSAPAISRRMAILCVDGVAWPTFDLPIANGWIDWEVPGFLGQDEDWSEFLRHKAQRYPSIVSDLALRLRSLDRVWIVRIEAGFKLTLVQEPVLRTAE